MNSFTPILSPVQQGSVITIGNFDGVHRGHRAMLVEARQLANELGCQLRAVTFDPHPRQVLTGSDATPRLMTLDQRVLTLQQAGADSVEVLRPTAELLGTEPEQFMQQMRDRFDARGFVEGHNFRFGKFRRGDVDLLREHGQAMGLRIVVVDPVTLTLENHHQAVVSSSLIRWLLEQGRVVDAALALGRPHALTGTVIRGEQRGRKLGFPTLNLDPAALGSVMLPADGVYAGTATVDGTSVPAAISVGRKPTFGPHSRVVEAHLLEFDSDLYDQTVTLRFTRWLRDQQPFPSLDALRAQLQRDVAAVRNDPARTAEMTTHG